jgi:subtilisin family serine protease
MLYDKIIFILGKIVGYIVNNHFKHVDDNLVNFKYTNNENVLLVPFYEEDYFFYNSDFVKEHNLETFVTIDNVVVYKTSYNNYKKFMYTFEQAFIVERDVDVNLELPSRRQDFYKNKAVNEWFLNRIVNKQFSEKDFEKLDCLNEQNVITYVVDTGIDIEHSEFEDRAVWGANFVDHENTDCNMHGTHVAGLIGSKTYGVCKNANLVAVKVLNCEGSGSYSGVLKGLEWVHKQHSNKQKSIVNMSLGGGKSKIIDAIIQKLVDTEGIYVVVAAGNENSDACNSSPAGVLDAMTVMASDIMDNKAYFSNWGKCADLYSPGVNILSTIPNQKTRILSGTSMASPIVAGIMNHYVEAHPTLNMKEIKELMLQNSTKNSIKKNPMDTNNFLVYLGQ